jgi:ketosteroid isomerase-like protein
MLYHNPQAKWPCPACVQLVPGRHGVEYDQQEGRRMRQYRPWVLALAFLALLAGCQQEEALTDDVILKVILRREAWWNDGSIEGYMETYWNSPKLLVASGDKVTFGWEETLDGLQKRYPDIAAMGNLIYSVPDITILSNDSALAFGTWKIVREKDQSQGLFTLLLRRFDDGWLIVHDHTSSAD